MHYTCLTLSSSDHRSVLELVNYVYEFHGLVQSQLPFLWLLSKPGWTLMFCILCWPVWNFSALPVDLKVIIIQCNPFWRKFWYNLKIYIVFAWSLVTYPVGGYEFFHDYGRQKRKHLELHQVSSTLWSRSIFTFLSLRNGHGLGQNLWLSL